VFQQDWEYVAGLGDLDECNGRKGVTPEFPNGTYHYVITDSYPYLQRCVKGTPADGGPPPPPAMVS
jgi:YHYH protein